MKRSPIHAILTLALALVALPALVADTEIAVDVAEAATGGPKAVAVKEVRDLGIVAKGEMLDVVFEIKNEGDAPLEITDVRPSCGCTVATYDETIAPGATGKVAIKIDTTNLLGPDSKRVTVLTNDASNPSIVLTVKSEVKPYLNAVPGYARFNVVQAQEDGMVSQSVWAMDGAEFKILSVDVPQEFYSTKVRVATEEERVENAEGVQYQVDLTLAKDAPIGPLTDTMVITTDHPEQPLIHIPVSGFVRPVLAVTPHVANFRKVELKEPLRANLLVKNYAVEEIKLKEIASTIPTIDAEIVPLEEGRRYQIRLLVSPETPKGAFEGKLKITTDSEKVPLLEVPVTGTVI